MIAIFLYDKEIPLVRSPIVLYVIHWCTYYEPCKRSQYKVLDGHGNAQPTRNGTKGNLSILQLLQHIFA